MNLGMPMDSDKAQMNSIMCQNNASVSRIHGSRSYASATAVIRTCRMQTISCVSYQHK